MKFLSIGLEAFGQFTDTELDLSDGAEGLHVIYGPNEAGKSTALRALRDLLFGIPETTTDDFLHQKPKMRIGGRLRNAAGAEITFRRRKGRKDTLLHADDTARPDDDLMPFLCGLDRASFARVFSMDHKELDAGGDEILAGRGDLGESLFAAGIGVSGLRKVLKSLDDEATGLFKRGGQNPAVNAAIARFLKARQEERAAGLGSEAWKEASDALRDAEDRRDGLLKERRDLTDDKSRLERIQRLAPLVGELRQVSGDLNALGDVVELPATFSDDRLQAERDLKAARTAAEDAAREIGKLEGELGAIVVPEGLLEAAANIEELHQSLGAYRTYCNDIIKRRGEKEALDREALALLSAVWPGRTLEQAESLRLTTHQAASLRKLAAARGTLDERLRTATRLLARTHAALDRTRKALAELPVARNDADLDRVVKQARRAGDIEDDLRRTTDDARVQAEVCRREATGLRGFAGNFEELIDLTVPSRETVDAMDIEFEKASRAVADAADAIRAQEDERANAAQALRAIELAGAAPLESELKSARHMREAGWQSVLRAWEGGTPVTAMDPEFDSLRPLPDAYGMAVAVADDVADRLRREAAQVQERASQTARAESSTLRLEQLREDLEPRNADLLHVQERWDSLWKPIGVVPGRPREMAGWLALFHGVVDKWQATRDTNSKAARLEERISGYRQAIADCLVHLGEPCIVDGESLQGMLDRAADLVDTIRSTEKKRRDLADAVATQESEAMDRAAEEQSVRDDLTVWDGEWTCAREMAGADISPETADAVLTRIDDLFKKVEESQRMDARIKGIERAMQAFELAARQLAVTLGGGLPAPPPEDPAAAARWLYDRLTDGRSCRDRRQAALDNLARCGDELASAQRDTATAEGTLVDLCRRARCDALDRLADLEARSRKAAALRAQAAGLRTRIAAESGGRDLTQVQADVDGEDRDALPGKLRELEGRIGGIEGDLNLAGEDIGSRKKQLQALRVGRPACELAEEAESALAAIREGVARYVPVKLAHALLRAEIEAYRNRNQGPLVTRASALFRDLTLQAFMGLASDFAEDDRPVLVAVRAAGKPVPVQHLSDGTRDQLYLALRLASLELHLSRNEAMPLVVDDIFVNFDDERTLAGLKVLANLSRRTQVILFTHHLRMVEAARDWLPAGSTFVHELTAVAPLAV